MTKKQNKIIEKIQELQCEKQGECNRMSSIVAVGSNERAEEIKIQIEVIKRIIEIIKEI